MGIHDRDYYRSQQNPSMPSIGMPKSIIGIIILINVVIFLIDAFTPAKFNIFGQPAGHWLSDSMAVHVETLWKPWLWWQMLTSGFAHSPIGFGHILGNMLVLFFLGRDIERLYGRKEFLFLYLVMVVFASFVWAVVNAARGAPPLTQAYGASGAIAGVVVLYALNFPNRTLLLFFVIPVPAWLLGFGIVIYDILGALGQAGPSNVAYAAHIAGAAFGFVYFQQRWRLSNIPLPKLKSRPKLRVHDPQAEEEALSEEVDRILAKLNDKGEASLSRKERKTLESASRKFKKRQE